jgi:hypothetical protein
VVRLNAAPGGCRQAIKSQLTELDNFEVAVQSVHVSATGAQPTATAHVTSTYAGKTRASTLSLVRRAVSGRSRAWPERSAHPGEQLAGR